MWRKVSWTLKGALSWHDGSHDSNLQRRSIELEGKRHSGKTLRDWKVYWKQQRHSVPTKYSQGSMHHSASTTAHLRWGHKLNSMDIKLKWSASLTGQISENKSLCLLHPILPILDLRSYALSKMTMAQGRRSLGPRWRPSWPIMDLCEWEMSFCCVMPLRFNYSKDKQNVAWVVG